MSDVPSLTLLDSSAQQPTESPFVTGVRVIFTARDGRRLPGQVVGPDQDYFPSPVSVFVSFPQTGFTLLVPVAGLEVAAPEDKEH